MLFSQKSRRPILVICSFLFTLLPKQSNSQGGAKARAVDLAARSFDLARPDVAPPLRTRSTLNRRNIRNVHGW